MTNARVLSHLLGCLAKPIVAGTIQSKLLALLLVLTLLALSRHAVRAMRFLGERWWTLEFPASFAWVGLIFSVAYVCVLIFLP